MSEKPPRIPADKVVKVLEKVGFVCVRQSGAIFKNKEGKRVTIPLHAKKVLHPKVLKSILRDANLTVEEFKELMK